MVEFNKERMIHDNHIENEFIRAKKRKIKEEIKQAKMKMNH